VYLLSNKFYFQTEKAANAHQMLVQVL